MNRPEHRVGMPLWDSEDELMAVARKRIGRLDSGSQTTLGYCSDPEAEQVKLIVAKVATDLQINVEIEQIHREHLMRTAHQKGVILVRRIPTRRKVT